MYVNLLCRCVRTGGRLIVVGCPCLSTGRNKMWVKKEYLSHLFPTGLCVEGLVVIEGWWDFQEAEPTRKSLGHWATTLKGSVCPFSFSFASYLWASSFVQPHMSSRMAWLTQVQSNGANQSWTRDSKILSQINTCFIYLLLLFWITCICVNLCMCVWVQYPWKPEEGIRFLWHWNYRKLWVLGLKLWSSGRTEVLLITKPTLHLFFISILGIFLDQWKAISTQAKHL